MIKVDCPECGGNGYVVNLQNPTLGDPCIVCEADGKITVYTEADVREIRKAERERCAKLLGNSAKGLSIWTQSIVHECTEAIRNMED